MEKIVNLTQHSATQEQIEQGVFDLEGKLLEELKDLLTFNEIPSAEGIAARAEKIAALVVPYSAQKAMIGGAPYLMGSLEMSLVSRGVTPVYSFTTRVSSEETQPDGSVRKTNVFRHAGFVSPLE